MGTIAGVTVFYILATLALVGMVPYYDINKDSGFVFAFRDVGWGWAQQICSVGEIVTLPLVVLISFLAQPRLQFAMAEDGMIPAFFSKQDKNGQLFQGTLWTGVAMTLVAVFVPFEPLNDMISAGVLLAFNFTNGCVVMANHRYHRPTLCPALLGVYAFSSCLAVFLWQYSCPLWVCILFTIPPAVAFLALWWMCPRGEGPNAAPPSFAAPFVPFFPCFGIAFNWYLIAELSWQGILEIVGYILLAVLTYCCYGYWHSVGNTTGWQAILSRNPPGSHAKDSSLIEQGDFSNGQNLEINPSD